MQIRVGIIIDLTLTLMGMKGGSSMFRKRNYNFSVITIERRLFDFIIIAILSITFFLFLNSAIAEEDSSGIRIGIIGDQTGCYDLNSAYQVLQDGVDILKTRNLDVVIHVGDLLESSHSEADIRNQWSNAMEILDQLPVNWFMTAGDHDVNPPVYQQDSTDRSREALWQELYGARVPDVIEHPWYSFDVGDYHFISLYSHQVLHADPRWGNIFLARILKNQICFLMRDLRVNRNAKAIIVFIHQPLWYHVSGWERVHQLLKRYPVAVVVSGHFHYDQEMEKLDGIEYITVGATGGTTKQGSRDAGNVHHVSVMEVKKKGKVMVTLLPIYDTEPLTLTPRRDMDRIQAMDVVLGGLWDFANRNPVFLKNGELVNSCDGEPPAKITVITIGNPTDLPADIQFVISSDAEEIGVASAGFIPGQCAEVISDYECILARSARIFYSNYSSTMVNTYGPALWEAELELNGTPDPGANIFVDFHFGFQGKQGEAFLTRTVTIPVGTCP